jgi:hypothetical protein
VYVVACLFLSFFSRFKTPATTAAAIQCVIYLRGVFPEEAFGEGEICGVSIRRLNPEGGIAEARQFLRYLDEGVLGAIKLNVLSSVELLFQLEQASASSLCQCSVL